MMKVSILVPVYGVEQYIERCARSLFEQTYPELEYVFVNDCTPDHSIEVLKRVMEDYPQRKPFVRVINHVKNRGVAAARNTLLDNACGDFLSWVDSDDSLELDAIELLVKKQEETDADIVTGKMCILSLDGTKRYVEFVPMDKGQLVQMQLKNLWTEDAFMCGRLLRRDLFENYHIRAKEGCNFGEDRYQLVRLTYYANKFAFVDVPVYHYILRASSITQFQTHDESTLLRNQFQHLHNWIGITDFFSNKEKLYYQLAVSNTSLLMKMNLDWVLKYNRKLFFFEIVGLIDENEDCMKALGWKKDGIKGVLLHNYRYMWLKQIARRGLRKVGRTLGIVKNG